jgi:ribonuclease MRP protein subunit RMP1
MLRRHVSKLITELDTNTKYTALSAKSKKTIESREIVERRVTFLVDVLMERCYVAFGQLVADNQYAALGLMLMGCLARLRRVLGLLRGNRDRDSVDDRDGHGVDKRDLEGELKDGMDAGEVVRREEVVGEEGHEKIDDEDEEEGTSLKKAKAKKLSIPAEEEQTSVAEDPTATKRPKKKRKKGDAFDDLFAGLV